MILNHQHRFLFVHVPKAAGTTITRALAPLTTFRDIEIGGTKYGEAIQDRFAARFDLRKHSTGAQIKAKTPGHIWRQFFVFGFVRNPYARAFSIYRFLRRWQDGPHHAMATAVSFEEFMLSEEIAAGEIQIALPQVHWLCEHGTLLPGIDFVGRVETFAADFGFALSIIHRKRMGWESSRHDNVSTKAGEWEREMTPAAQARIETIYADDFEIWGYPLRAAGAQAA